MKILWVNPSFLDYRIPVYKMLYKLCNGDFYILFSKARVPERIPIKIKEAIGKNAICFEGEKRIIIGEAEGMSNKWSSIPISKGLYKRIKRVNADIIIAEGFFQWTPKAILYAILQKKPIFIAYERTIHTERNCPKWRTAYRKLIDKFVTGYLCNGLQTQEYLEFIGVKKNKIHIGGMSADSKQLAAQVQNFSSSKRDSFETKLAINKKGLTFLYTGRLIKRKGVIYLLNAWIKHLESYPNDNLLIVGTGELFDPFKQKFGQEKSIKLIGEIEYDTIYKYYAIADVFIIPTLEDNWSLVVPEAMACGLPIACSIYNGCYPELVLEGENGVLFDPLKEDTLLNALNHFHHVDLKIYSENSTEIEKKYSPDNATRNIYDICIKTYNKNKHN